MDYIEKIFGLQQEELMNKNKDKIIAFLHSCTDEIILEDYELSYDDAKEKESDDTYLKNVDIKIDGKSIKFLLLDKKTLKFIKNNLPKSIKKITIFQSSLNNDISFLNGLESLQQVNIRKGYSLLPKDIKSLKENTNIKNINVDVLSYMINIDYLKEEGFYISENPSAIYYQGLLIKDKRNDVGDSVIIETKDELNLGKVQSFINMLNISPNIITVKSSNIKYTVTPDIEGFSLDVYSSNPNDANKVYDFYKDKIDISDITYHISDKSYLDIDINCLKSIQKNVFINYGEPLNTSLDGFESLQSSIKYYKQLINDYDLSAVEKLMFAYDIMKTFKYNEGQNIADSRYAANVIETGHIVCGGYAQMMVELLKNIKGIGIEYQTVSCYDNKGKYKGGHARNLVRVDDDKYNIHGIYAIDATWDSDKKTSKIAGEDYSSLDLYNYFLIPYMDYENVFKNDTLPNILQEYYNEQKGKANDLLSDAKVLFDNDVNIDYIKDYINVKRLPLEELLKIIYNVRLTEGYSKEQAQKELEKIERINAHMEMDYKNKKVNDVNYFRKGVN